MSLNRTLWPALTGYGLHGKLTGQTNHKNNREIVMTIPKRKYPTDANIDRAVELRCREIRNPKWDNGREEHDGSC